MGFYSSFKSLAVLLCITTVMQGQHNGYNNISFDQDGSISKEIASNDFSFYCSFTAAPEFEQSLHVILLSNRGKGFTSAREGVWLGFHGQWGNSPYKILQLNHNHKNYFQVNCPLLLDGGRHEILIIKKNLTLSFYADGQHLYDRELKENINIASNNPFHIGKDLHSTNSRFKGELHEIQLYNMALNATQVKDVFKNVKRKKLNNLAMVAYKFDKQNMIEGNYKDLSGNNRHAYIAKQTDFSDSSFKNGVIEEGEVMEVFVEEDNSPKSFFSSTTIKDGIFFNINVTENTQELQIYSRPINERVIVEIRSLYTNKVLTSTLPSKGTLSVPFSMLGKGLHEVKLKSGGKQASKFFFIND